MAENIEDIEPEVQGGKWDKYLAKDNNTQTQPSKWDKYVVSGDVKKKDIGVVSSPIPLRLPSQNASSPDFEKGQRIANQGFLMGEGGGGQPQPEGSYLNIGQNLRQKTVEKAAEVDAATIGFLRNLSGKIPFIGKTPDKIYDENGQLTSYGQNIPSSDFLGRALKSINNVKNTEQQLQQTTGKLPDTMGGQIAEGITSIIPDIALSAISPGGNIFKGGKIAKIGNALTSKFAIEQGITGASKGYNESEKKAEGVGDTFMNTLKEGGKGYGEGLLMDLAGFGSGKISKGINKKIALEGFKGIAAKEAVKLATTTAMYSAGVPIVQEGVQGKFPTKDEFLKNLGIASVFGALHLGKNINDHIQLNSDLKKLNQFRNVSALNNFVKAPYDVIDNLVQSGESSEKLNLAALDAANKASKSTDIDEKRALVNQAKNLTQAADIKHITDRIINSNDGLNDIANELPGDIKDEFMQKAKILHQTSNPIEVQKQQHADEISKAENTLKENENLAQDTNPNVLERIEAKRKIDEANRIIDENTKNLNDLLDNQNKEKTKSKAEQIKDISDEDYNNFINNGEVSDEVINSIADKIKNKEQLTDKENEIFHDKTDLINENLKNSFIKENPNDIESKKADIEKRRQEELNTLDLLPIVEKEQRSPELQKRFDKIEAEQKLINDKYDAELSDLEKNNKTKEVATDDVNNKRKEQYDVLVNAANQDPNFKFTESFEDFNKNIDSEGGENYLRDLYKKAEPYVSKDIIGEDKGHTEDSFVNYLTKPKVEITEQIGTQAPVVEQGEVPIGKEQIVNIPIDADPDYVKMANAVNDTFVKNKFGLKALDDIIDKLNDTNLKNILEKAKEKINLDPKNFVKNTVDRILTTKQGGELDQAVLMYDLAQLKGAEQEYQRKIIESTNPKDIAYYQDEILKVQNQMMDNALANRILGREASTMFRLRQLWVNKDLTVGDMMEQYKASKGVTELTPSEQNDIRAKHKSMLESKSKLEAAKVELEKAREEAAKLQIENEKLKELVENADKQKKSEREKKVSETIQKSNERVQKSLDNLKKLGGNLNAGFDPKIAIELGKIAAEKVYQGVVKFDKLVKDVYDDIKDVLPGFTIEDVRTHLLTEYNKAGELVPTLLSEKYNNLKKSLDKSEKTVREKVTSYEKAQKEMALKQWDWQQDRRQDMMSKKPIMEQIGDKLLQWQRFSVLSYPSTFVKLAAVVAHGLLLKPFKFGVGKLISSLTPESVKEKQTIWGDPKWSSLGKYYSAWLKNFSAANLKEVMSGRDTKELLYGRPMMYDELNASGSLMEMPGRSHGYIKSFIKNPEFAYAHEQQVTFNLSKMAKITEELQNPNLSKLEKKALKEEYKMYDVTNEDVIQRINQQSLNHAKWAILMNDNKFTDKFRQFTKNTGIVGKIVQSELPIVKIPINFVGRAFATKYGIIRAIMGKSSTESNTAGGTSFPGIAELIYKGTKNLTEDQANLLGRTLQIGTIGAGFTALGFWNYKKIHKNDDGSYQVFDKHISKNLSHSPEFESIISGAETMQRMKEKGESFIQAWLESDAEILSNNPFMNLLKYGASVQLAQLMIDMQNPKKKANTDFGKAGDILNKKIVDMIQPGFMKQTATSFDTEEPGFHPMGTTTKRVPAGEATDRWWQQFEMGVPGLRQNVPTENKAKSIKQVEKDMQGEKLKETRTKVIENLKKANF